MIRNFDFEARGELDGDIPIIARREQSADIKCEAVNSLHLVSVEDRPIVIEAPRPTRRVACVTAEGKEVQKVLAW